MSTLPLLMGLLAAAARASEPAPASPPPAPPEPAAEASAPADPLPAATAADFGCLQDWPAVGNTRFHSLGGDVSDALAVAKGERPGPFPAGTVVQLMPTEAMVKLSPGASPQTDDWEYLKLKVGRKGVEIAERGGIEVKNIAGSCHGCHETDPGWDHVCGATHGCDPLPGFIVKAALKAVEKDPRCR